MRKELKFSISINFYIGKEMAKSFLLIFSIFAAVMYFQTVYGANAVPAETLTCEIPENAVSVKTIMRAGSKQAQVTLVPVAGKDKVLTFRTFSITTGITDINLLNAGVEIAELGVRNYVRPNILAIGEAEFDKTILGWGKFPNPQTYHFSLEFQQNTDGVDCYFDGKYAGCVLPGGKLKNIHLLLPADAAAEPFKFRNDEVFFRGNYYLIDLSCLKPADTNVVNCKLNSSLPVPLLKPATVPFDLAVTAGQQSRTGPNQTAYYTYRSAYDNRKDSFILTVPRAQYIRAWVLAAVDEASGKDSVLTARLTRFVSDGVYSGRARECLADTSVTLPVTAMRKITSGITLAGSVEIKGRVLPLYLVEIILDSGSIQDLIFYEQGAKQRGTAKIGNYLDLELLGRLNRQDRPHPFGDNRMYPDSRHVSGVHVFGITLEKTPVEMEIRQTQPGNIFHNGEKPEIMAALRVLQDGEYQLNWTINDVDGNIVGRENKKLLLKVGDGEQVIPVPLQQPQVGWYEICFELKQADRILLKHQASFALLGPDTRQAGYESPYGSWWMQKWHYGTPDPAIEGPLMLKAGFRRIAIMIPDKTSEAELAPWKLTAITVGWEKLASLLTKNAPDAEIEKYISEYLKRYPHCDNVTLFHESIPEAPYRNAPELFGLPPVSELKNAPKRHEMVMRIAKIIREKFPQLKIIIGNSLASTELLAEELRRKYPESYADYIGIETVGRTCLPERISEYGQAGVWMLRETARKFNYKWGGTASFECNYRQDRLIGAERKAQWYARDMLLGHAYRFPAICLAGMDSFGNSYNASFWGDIALCARYPLLYPRKSYVSVATLTKVLDQVKLLREVQTKSNSIYALEFLRADKKYIYAIWTGRGTAELTLNFPNDGSVEIIDMYGRSRKETIAQNRIKISAGTAVQYLACEQPVGEISYGKRTYPQDQPAVGFKKVAGMESVADWQIFCDKDPLLELCSEARLPFRTAGTFTLSEVTDDEKGQCLEVELKARNDLPTPLLSEYSVVRLKKPVLLTGCPDTLGVWVKGNSGWGQLYFEIEDANGARMISCGTTVHKGDVFDYEGRMSINFDGWNFLSIPVTDKSPIPDLSTGNVQNLWESSGKNKTTPPVYPVKLTGIGFAMPQQAIYLTEMQPVKQVLRFKEVLACEQSESPAAGTIK